MTDRIPLDHLTSDQYDELCDRLEHAESELRDWAERDSADAAAGSYALRAEHVEATIARVQALADRWVKAGPPPLGTSMARWWDKRLVELNAALAEPGPARAAGPAWAPPPPGDWREQLPDHLLDLIRGSIPDYTSTACVTAYTLAVAVHWSHPRRAELGQWAERLHQRCRRNQKFTGQLCACGCH